MKILKLKSFLFSLLAIGMITVLLTSCEREVILDENNFLETFITEEGKEFLVDEKIDGATEIIEENVPNLYESDVETMENELRSSCYTVAYLGRSSVCWYSDRTLALWIRHFRSNGSYISTTRIDVGFNSCGFAGANYRVHSSRASSVAFVGYPSNSTESYP